MPINKIHARQIFDSRGNPTVEVDLYTERGMYCLIILVNLNDCFRSTSKVVRKCTGCTFLSRQTVVTLERQLLDSYQ